MPLLASGRTTINKCVNIRNEMKSDMTLFPDTPLRAGTPIANAFLHIGCATFGEAAHYLHTLPYGRNASRSDFILVLREKRGTCSSKHALLTQLAREIGVAIDLVVGIYEMNDSNTSGIGAILQQYGLAAIPEAHCVVWHNGHYADITRQTASSEPIVFVHEEFIEPWQVAEYKVQMHRQYLRAWCERNGLLFDDVWNIREQCIAAL